MYYQSWQHFVNLHLLTAPDKKKKKKKGKRLIKTHCCVFENGVLLMYMLEGVNSVANFITTYEESQ